MNEEIKITTTLTLTSSRVASIDLLRGIIMIIMALDHVRDYFHADNFLYSPTDLSKTSGILFFTRWITHFCAPIFVFLAGTSAFMMSRRKSKTELSGFLFKRGVLLVLLDLTVLTFGWTFDFAYHNIIFNVIWMFGISMIVLAALIQFPVKAILCIGLIIVLGHNLLDTINFETNPMAFVWAVLHKQAFFSLGERQILLAYPLIPWIAVMALGYCLGSLYASGYEPVKRKKILIITGFSTILFFIVLRMINVYGDSQPWGNQNSALFTLLSFLNTTKYPPSLLFLLMTLGPALLFLAYTESINSKASKVLSVFGRVPLFYYIVHIYVIHLLAMFAANLIPGFSWQDLSGELPWFGDKLKGFGFSLSVVYVVWIAVVLALYPLCKWYDLYKQRHKEKWWLNYL